MPVYQMVKKLNKSRKANSEGDPYPKPNYLLLAGRTMTKSPNSGWVDRAYKKYEFKSAYPFHCLISLESKHVPRNTVIDDITDYFKEQLRKVCTAHIVARIIFEDMIHMFVYVDHADPAIELLKRLNSDSVCPFEFGAEVHRDSRWTEVAPFFKQVRD